MIRTSPEAMLQMALAFLDSGNICHGYLGIFSLSRFETLSPSAEARPLPKRGFFPVRMGAQISTSNDGYPDYTHVQGDPFFAGLKAFRELFSCEG